MVLFALVGLIIVICEMAWTTAPLCLSQTVFVSICAFFVLFLTVLLVRGLRCGVDICPGGIFVRGLLESKWCPWGEIKEIDHRPLSVTRTRVILSDGSVVRVTVAPTFFEHAYDDLAAELKAELEARTGGGEREAPSIS